MKLLNAIIGLASLLILAFCLNSYVENMKFTPTIDYFTFWAVPKVLFAPPHAIKNFYAEDDQRRMYATLKNIAEQPDTSERQRNATYLISQYHYNTLYATASPFLYTVIGPLSSGDYDRDQRVFLILSLVCFVSAIIIYCCTLKIHYNFTIWLLIFFLTSFSPLIKDTGLGNVNQIQLFSLALVSFCMAKSRFLSGGAVLGMSLMFKPNVFMVFIALVLLFAIDRTFAKLRSFGIGLAVGVAISLAASSIYFGSTDVWINFFRSLPKTLDADTPMFYGNLGFCALIFYYIKTRVSAIILLLMVSLFAYVINASRNKDSRGNNASVQEMFAITGVGLATMLLSVDLVWYHYYMFVIPVCLFLLRPTPNMSIKASTAVRVTTITAMLMFTEAVEIKFVCRPQEMSILFNLTVILLTSIGLYQIYRLRRYAGYDLERF